MFRFGIRSNSHIFVTCFLLNVYHQQQSMDFFRKKKIGAYTRTIYQQLCSWNGKKNDIFSIFILIFHQIKKIIILKKKKTNVFNRPKNTFCSTRLFDVYVKGLRINVNLMICESAIVDAIYVVQMLSFAFVSHKFN